MSVPKVLLLVNSRPGAQGSGEIWLRELCNAYPKGRLIRFSTLPQECEESRSEWCGVPTATAEVRSTRIPIMSSVAVWHAYGAARASVADRAVAFARQHQPDIVWSVPNSPALIALTLEVVSRMSKALVTSVLDPPGYFTRNLNLDPWTSQTVKNKFRELVVRSKRLSAISEGMQVEIGKVTQADCCILRQGFSETEWRKTKKELCSDDEIRIGFAGSMYAKTEWRALLSAVESANGRLLGRRVRIIFVGRKPRLGVPGASFVEFVGVRTPQQTVEAMADVDLCYVPYWFSRRRADAAIQSFPSKISAYAAAGTPVLFHGPPYSSPVAFLRQYPMGIFCNSLNPEAILTTIAEFVQNDTLRKTAAEAITSARNEQLGRTVMLKRFARLIGIEPRELVS